jgi:hypothetical protein
MWRSRYLVQRLSKRLADLHRPHEMALIDDAVAVAREAGFGDEVGTLAAEYPAASGTVLTRLLSDDCAVSPSRDDVEAMLISAGASEVSSPGADDADPFVAVAAKLYAEFARLREQQKALLSERDVYLGRLMELQKRHSSEIFYPDANRTLRISAGHVEGYQAADAVQHAPHTTIAGLLDKHAEAVLLAGDGDGSDAGQAGGVFSCEPAVSILKSAHIG